MYYDEELLEAKRERERRKHTTLETGIYAGDELIEVVYIILPNSQIYVPLPKRFVVMPEVIKNVKYPSMFAPEFIMSSLDVTVNFGFNQLKINDGDVRSMCILHVVFSCPLEDKENWVIIIEQIFISIKEEL